LYEILLNLQMLDQSESDYIIRVPVIPGVNDDRKSFEHLLQYIQPLHNPRKEIHFLPYHPLAKHKLKFLDMEDKMVDSKRISDSELSKLASEFENAGYKVKIGG